MKKFLLALAFLALASAASADGIDNPGFASVGEAGINTPYIPLFQWNFRTAGALPSWVSFSRADCNPSASCASYFNSSAVLTFAATNAARFDYSAVNTPTGLLTEATATNLAVNSNALTAASWSINLVSTPSQDGTLGPDGTASAWLITPTASTGNHYVTDAVPIITSAVNYGKAVFVKANGNNFILMLVKNNAATNWTAAVFDLTSSSNTTASQTASGGTSAIVSTSQQALPNGWYRIAMVSSFTGTAGNLNLQLAPAATANTINASGISWTTAGTEKMYLYGADWELGSFITSYNPVGSSGEIRAVDAPTLSGAASTAAGVGPSILEYQDQATGALSRVQFAAGAFAFQAAAWNRAVAVYPRGTPSAYLATRLTVGTPF